MRKQYYALICVAVAILLLVGCSEENTTPIIDEFIVPENVAPGSQVDFQVVAHDADGDILSYTWKVDKTQLNATTPTITWKAPNIDQYVTVEVRVSDGVNDPVIRKKTLKVGKSKQEEKQEFISFLDRLGLVSNGDTPFVGMLMWSFSSNGIVLFGSVQARIGNSWLVSFYAGNYTLSSRLDFSKTYWFKRERLLWREDTDRNLLETEKTIEYLKRQIERFDAMQKALEKR